MARPFPTILALALLAISSSASAKKINPNNFTTVAIVKEVNLESSIDCSQAVEMQKERCISVASISHIPSVTSYLMETEIGGKTYTVRGPRLELGTYKARFASNGNLAFVFFDKLEILLLDKRGKQFVSEYMIVGERK